MNKGRSQEKRNSVNFQRGNTKEQRLGIKKETSNQLKVIIGWDNIADFLPENLSHEIKGKNIVTPRSVIAPKLPKEVVIIVEDLDKTFDNNCNINLEKRNGNLHILLNKKDIEKRAGMSQITIVIDKDSKKASIHLTPYDHYEEYYYFKEVSSSQVTGEKENLDKFLKRGDLGEDSGFEKINLAVDPSDYV